MADDLAEEARAALASTPVFLTIRFTASLPDLSLTVPLPAVTSVGGVKQQIRRRIPAQSSTRRLRLIHAGKVLQDGTSLAAALRLPTPPDSSVATPSASEHRATSTTKGKERAQPSQMESKQTKAGDAGSKDLVSSLPTHVYINCSVGDALTLDELAQEAMAAKKASQALQASIGLERSDKEEHETPAARSSTTPPAQGFDRLLSAGFTAQEVSTLRQQFVQLQAYSRTPDEMPTAAEMRVLEDRWIDDSAGPLDGMIGTGGGMQTGDDLGVPGGDPGGGGSGAYEDLLIGNVIGFLWPIGAVLWLLREEGVWSWRRQMAVFTGMLVNMAFSVLRITN